MLKILVVESIHDIYTKIKDALSSDYNIYIVKSYEDALESIRINKEVPFSMIIIDIDQKELQGEQLVEDIYHSGLSKETGIMVVTSDVSSHDMVRICSYDVDDYWIVGLLDETLTPRIRGLIRKYDPQDTTGLILKWGKNKNNFVFDECIGAALFMVYNGKSLYPVIINDAFYKVFDYPRRDKKLLSINLLEAMPDEYLPSYMKAVNAAIDKGVGVCQISNSDTGKLFRITLRHVSHNGGEDLLFCLADDITESLNAFLKVQAISSIPGTLIYDYDVLTDRLIANLSNENEMQTIIENGFINSGEVPEWLSPHSVRLFNAEISKATKLASSGSFDFRAKIHDTKFRWYKAYYRSIANSEGDVFRVVGRVEEVNDYLAPVTPEENTSLYDSTTRLLTYHALKEFISKQLDDYKSGTMFMLGIEDLDDLSSEVGNEMTEKLLQAVTKAICELFRETDIIGRFGREGFIIFLPEAYSESFALKKANEILALLDHRKHLYENTDKNSDVNIGIAIEDNKDVEVGELLRFANNARWKAKNTPGQRVAVHKII
ncbi:MAG: response regulator [Blautia sp.]|nr:response regulator [Blautia sp.]